MVCGLYGGGALYDRFAIVDIRVHVQSALGPYDGKVLFYAYFINVPFCTSFSHKVHVST